MMYGVNENGLVEFDGIHWNEYKGSEGITRSLYVMNDSIIYTGSDVDFGLMVRNKKNQFEYTSLYPQSINNSFQNEEFWNIYKVDNKVIFQSHTNLYSYENGLFTKLPAPIYIANSSFSNNTIYLFDSGNKVYTSDGSQIRLLFQTPFSNIITAFELGDTLYFLTKNSGIYTHANGEFQKLQSEIDRDLQQNEVFSAISLSQQYIAIGTILNGIYIIDREGKLISHINKKSGLVNNTILSMATHPNQQLFLGLNYGVSVLNLNSPNHYFIDYEGKIGEPSKAIVYNEDFYVASNQGLYKSSWLGMNSAMENYDFQLIPNSQGQVWNIKKLNGETFIGHNLGTFILEKGMLKQIHDEPGTWDFASINSNVIITGKYNGLNVLKKEGHWKFLTKIPGLNISCNQVLWDGDNETLWVVFGDNQVGKIKLNEDYSIRNRKIYYLEGLNFRSFRLEKSKESIKLSGPNFAYIYDHNKDSFIRKAEKNNLNIPLVNRSQYIPNPLNSKLNFIPFEQGFVLQEINKKNPILGPLNVLIRSVQAFNNEENRIVGLEDEIPYRFKNIRFSFASPFVNNIQYRYRLNNEEWSNWSRKNSAEILDLSHGLYTIQIQAKREGEIYTSKGYTFSIETPWYKSFWAYLVYIALGLLLYFLYRRMQQTRLQKQREEIKNQERISLQEQADRYKRSQLKQENEDLKGEILELNKNLKNKNLELARNTKKIIDQSKVFENLKKIIQNLKISTPQDSIQNIRTLERLVDKNISESNDSFTVLLDESNEEYFNTLKSKHPNLTLNNLRLAAYLKAGLSTQEIAEINNVLPSSVNINRSRLRKKLGLNTEDDLFKYLNSI